MGPQKSPNPDGYDKVWVVFDRDDFESWREAIREAEENDFALAISNPCFELWALLTQAEHRSALSTRDAQRRFKKHQPKYRHDHVEELPLEQAFTDPRIASAHKRAEQLRADAQEEHANPSTSFDLLIECIRAPEQQGPCTAPAKRVKARRR